MICGRQSRWRPQPSTARRGANPGGPRSAGPRQLPVPDMLSRPDEEPSDDPAARVEGAPTKAGISQKESPLAGVQAADLLCREPLR